VADEADAGLSWLGFPKEPENFASPANWGVIMQIYPPNAIVRRHFFSAGCADIYEQLLMNF
jgi:hypothetical protein